MAWYFVSSKELEVIFFKREREKEEGEREREREREIEREREREREREKEEEKEKQRERRGRERKGERKKQRGTVGKETARNRERERIKGKKYVINRERTTNTKGLIKKSNTWFMQEQRNLEEGSPFFSNCLHRVEKPSPHFVRRRLEPEEARLSWTATRCPLVFEKRKKQKLMNGLIKIH